MSQFTIDNAATEVTPIDESTVIILETVQTFDSSAQLFVCRDYDGNVVWGIHHDSAYENPEREVSYDLSLISAEFDRLEAYFATEMLQEFGGDTEAVEQWVNAPTAVAASSTIISSTVISYDDIPF